MAVASRSRKPNTWVTDITHHLDESGQLPSLPGPVRNLANFFGAIVASMSSEPPGTPMSTLVRCRRRPGRTRCRGEILAVIEPEGLHVEGGVPSLWRQRPHPQLARNTLGLQ